MERKQNAGKPINVDKIVRDQCEEYRRDFESLIEGQLGERLCVIQYEQMVAKDLSPLHRFGLTDIDPGKLWESKIHQMGKSGGGAYITPLYGGELSPASVGRYQEVLDKEKQALVLELCGDVADKVRALAA
ncbi:hypothetical protein N177_1899 [Lutibaculum baratangense AMV1]|uniref:Uncharacterized protein n=1 Tax=Lutibaculum baratangense AMV1 TaxID=631454 RepID=V4QZN1_9HYPH|nr:hypothetical protein N177_1899 [Lutibaculum baratangense AMV1]